MLLRTQVYLTKMEKESLSHLSQQMGKSQSELIREAIDLFCESHLEEDRLALIKSARGLWKKRSDLPDFAKLRKELDRSDDKDD